MPLGVAVVVVAAVLLIAGGYSLRVYFSRREWKRRHQVSRQERRESLSRINSVGISSKGWIQRFTPPKRILVSPRPTCVQLVEVLAEKEGGVVIRCPGKGDWPIVTKVPYGWLNSHRVR